MKNEKSIAGRIFRPTDQGKEPSEQSKARLDHWKGVVERDRSAWAAERKRMDKRDELFYGTQKMDPTVQAEEKLRGNLSVYHVRNVIAENIESMVDSRVPRPKVTALNKTDETLAATMEHLLQSYSDRHHLRVLNDLAERMGPIQGGVFWLTEWDDTIRTPDGRGDVRLTILHPKQVIPQAGIYTDVDDMDHITVMLTMSVQQVLERFGVDLHDRTEEDPESRGTSEELGSEEDLRTIYQLYYRNGRGGIGTMIWADDVVLCDREDYQARTIRRCRSCGAPAPMVLRLTPERKEELRIAGQLDESVPRCEFCEGTEFEDGELDEEIIMPPGEPAITTADGVEIVMEPAVGWIDEQERIHYEPRTKLPYYKPGLMPIVLQKNISRFGRLLGESDVDKMESAQNLLKRLDKKIVDKLVKAGTLIALPKNVRIETSTDDQRVIRTDNPADLQMIQTFELSGNISQELEMSARAYEEARQATGVTDSMQGRRDPTATSAKAKEYSASKSEGRMESRRVMKEEAWGKIFERIAKLYLSCADEGRRVRVETATGEVDYKEFYRKEFLKVGKKQEYYYEDGFVFGCDNATSIGESREAMWQEINSAFSAGTLGSPQELSTRILYWGLMEEQHYPGADGIKKKLEKQAEEAAQTPAPPAGQGQGGTPLPTAPM